MGVIKDTFFAIECDICKDNSSNWTEIWFSDSGDAQSAADEYGWIVHEDKHYCPGCYSRGDDGSIIINTK